MYRPRTNIPRKKKTNKRPVPGRHPVPGLPRRQGEGTTSNRKPRRQGEGRTNNRKKVDLRKTADELRAGIKPALRRIDRKNRIKREGPGHMGMGFAGGGKIKTKGYAQGGAMKTKGGAKGGKKFTPPRRKNTGLFG